MLYLVEDMYCGEFCFFNQIAEEKRGEEVLKLGFLNPNLLHGTKRSNILYLLIRHRIGVNCIFSSWLRVLYNMKGSAFVL